MSPRQPNSPTRTRIVLEGGGRLEDVAQIVEIRLQPEPVEWTRVEAGTLEVHGAINAYFYCLRSKGRGVEGQGFRIPFSRRIPAPELPIEGMEVHLEELESNHDFNPITGDFQHKVSAFVVLKGSAHEPSLEEAPAQTDAPSQADSTPPPAPSGPSETRLSQVRNGERPLADADSQDAPMSTRPPSPEEFESMRQAVEGKANQGGAESRLPPSSPPSQPPERVPEETSEPKQGHESDRVAEQSPKSAPNAGPTKAAPQEKAPPQEAKKRGEALVWKPFPPPIN